MKDNLPTRVHCPEPQPQPSLYSLTHLLLCVTDVALSAGMREREWETEGRWKRWGNGKIPKTA